jgi:vacuolar protein sorting-associated protein 13A/C
MPYAWDYPAAKEKKMLLVINGTRRTVDIKEIGDLVPFKFTVGQNIVHLSLSLRNMQDLQRNRVVSLDVRAEGHKQILRITNYNPERSLYKPKSRNSGTVRTDTFSGAEAFEAVTEEVPPSLAFSIDFAGIGISLINRKLVEVVYISVDALKFDYTNSAVAQTVNLACGTVQIDNQLHEALYPVILQPTPIAKESNRVAALPTVQGSVIWLKDQGKQTSCF